MPNLELKLNYDFVPGCLNGTRRFEGAGGRKDLR